MRTKRRGPGPHQHLEPAILLLEMLGTQKHAFLPDDPVRPCHRRLPFSRTAASRKPAFDPASGECGREAANLQRQLRWAACGDWRHGAPMRLVDVAEQHGDTDELHALLELAGYHAGLARAQHELL